MARTRFAVLLLVAAVFALARAVPALLGLLTDWWWFQEVGFQIVFSRRLTTEALLFLGVGSVTALTVYANLRIAQRGAVRPPILFDIGTRTPQIDVQKALREGLRRIGLPAALLIGLMAGLAATPLWGVALQAIEGRPFGTVDPVFSRDVGFYVFTLPALEAGLAILTGLAFVSLLAVGLVYWTRADIMVSPRGVELRRPAGIHLGALVAALFVLTAVHLWVVDSAGLLYSSTGPLIGASYSDLTARLPGIRISAAAALVGAAVVMAGALRERAFRSTLVAIVGYVAVAVVGRGVYPMLIQKFVVAPTELTRETPYLTSHIAATRAAWGLDSVEVRDLGGESTLTAADLRANVPTIENVRLWERDPLLQTFGQLQEIRTYYDFVSVDDDRYWIDGAYRQVLLSPRELNPTSLPTRTFINEHLTFTHGMGLTLSPVNQVTPEGLPVLFVKDLPPASSVSLAITRPQIYFGELTDDYVLVGTEQREFDYPSGEENVYTAYAGTGGVRVGGLLRRLVLAARFASSKILLSQDITGESRILYNRDITGRAARALPFLTFDRDPYMVIAEDGRLVWLLDAYTRTDRYPYAERLPDGTSYMRNSVKVVIDAYDGSIAAFVAAPADPLIRTWERIFPGIFAPLDSLPADLRAHLRYPDQLYQIQTTLYATFHMDDPVDFYHREDQWQIPVVNAGTGAVPFLRHIIMKLPEETEAEYVYMVPFTPRGKDNLAAWMVARNDGAELGKLLVYRLSRQSLVFGPTQIENRINQNTEISQQVSLWDQGGSEVIWGDLLVIPIGTALLYVQPLYLRAEGGKIPELKRVVVAYQNEVAMAETLDGSLARLFGGSAAPGEAQRTDAGAVGAPLDPAFRAMTTEARQRYQAAMDALSARDFARYGEEIRRLGELLDQITAESR